MRARYLILIVFLWMGLGCKKNVQLSDIEIIPGAWQLAKYQLTSYKNGSPVKDDVNTNVNSIARFQDNGNARLTVAQVPNLRNDSVRYTLSNRVFLMTFINDTTVTFNIKTLDINNMTLETRSAITTDADLNKIQTIANYFYTR